MQQYALHQFTSAAQRLPREAAPHLALARVYVYALPDADKAMEEFAAAERLGAVLGRREIQQQGDAYRIRAKRRLIAEPRAADLRPGAAPAGSPAGSGSVLAGGKGAVDPGTSAEAAGPWVPAADRFSVLAAALDQEEADRPALEVLRDELGRANHLAHLGAIWADLVGRVVVARCDAVLGRELGSAEYGRYTGGLACSALYREVRAAELAGLDAGELLARAVRLRPLDDRSGRGAAENIAKVLRTVGASGIGARRFDDGLFTGQRDGGLAIRLISCGLFALRTFVTVHGGARDLTG